MKVATFEKLMRKQETRTNGRDNVIHDLFLPSERYSIDFADDFTVEGWQQFDTDQDAPYFGVWVNPTKLLTLAYAEGDWTLVVCADVEHYNAEIKDMCDFYGEGFEFKTIDTDTGQITEYRQDRSTFEVDANA